MACQWIVDLVAAAIPSSSSITRPHPDEWTWRLDGLGGASLRRNVWYVAPSLAGWEGPIWDHWEKVRELAQTVGALVVVIDSVAIASAGWETKDDKTASAYATAVQRIGGAVLSIAHVTKAGIGKWPYGRCSGTTWRASRGTSPR